MLHLSYLALEARRFNLELKASARTLQQIQLEVANNQLQANPLLALRQAFSDNKATFQLG